MIQRLTNGLFCCMDLMGFEECTELLYYLILDIGFSFSSPWAMKVDNLDAGINTGFIAFNKYQGSI